MNNIFSGCESLKSLPDISKWNTIHITNMSQVFNCCISLSSLPDISKWNIINVTDISYIFVGSKSLYPSVPNFSLRKYLNNRNYLIPQRNVLYLTQFLKY